jgi:hypothetical protein
VNFTREPIIETIITPRDGCRLVIRSSRHESQEEFTVDAVEVVSFGHALFFRSLEKPRPFLVPVGDYEVVEVKESRVVLKNAQFERTIKIGGGREGSLRKDEEEQALPVSLEDEIADESGSPSPQQDKQKRDRGGRRQRRRRPYEERDDMKQRVEEQQTPQEFKPALPREPRGEARGEPKEASKEPPKEPQGAPSFQHLIPPPTTLISQNIQKYKDQQSGNAPQEPESRKADELKSEPDSDSSPISRMALEESQPLTTNFSNLNGWNHFLS